MRLQPLSLLLLLVSLWFQTAQAQHDCSAHGCFHAEVISKPFSVQPDTLPLDTGIHHFHWVPEFSSSVFFPALSGNTGRPGVNLWRSFSPDKSSGYFYHNPYKYHFLSSDNLEIIRSSLPFADWYYLTGAHREQLFRAVHALDAGKNLNFGIDLKFINSKGAYLHQHTKTSYAAFYAQYRDPVIPIESDLVVVFNRATAQENGGISDPEWFEDTVNINRQLVPVWSNTAMTHVKSSEVRLINRWSPGSLKRSVITAAPTDSLLMDTVPSIAVDVRKRVLDHLFTLDLSLVRFAALYHDADPQNPWYPVVRYDSALVTHDTVSSMLLSADLAYRVKAWDRIFVAAGLIAGSHMTHDTLNLARKGSFLEAYTHWQFRLWPAMHLDARAALRQDQVFGTMHVLDASLHYKMTKKLKVSAALKDWTAAPYLQDQMYASNHFFWINDFKQQHYSQIFSSIQYQGKLQLSLEGFLTRVANLVYYDSRAMPVQLLEPVTLWQGMTTAAYRVGRWNLTSRVALQRSSNNAVLRQPVVLGEASAAYRFSLFSGKITAMGGLILHGATASYRDEYSPVTRVFFLTSQTPQQAYGWVDPFVTFVLKKTRFMLRYDHASAWLAGFGQYTITGYPMPDPALKFAVSWRFME